jgi:hypothetical protein
VSAESENLRFSDGSLITPALDEGIRLFNAGEFFDCHEVLEDAWRENDNLEGAIKVMRSGLPQLHAYSNWPGIELKSFIPDLERCLKEFLSLESTGNRFNSSLIPVLKKR